MTIVCVYENQNLWIVIRLCLQWHSRGKYHPSVCAASSLVTRFPLFVSRWLSSQRLYAHQRTLMKRKVSTQMDALFLNEVYLMELCTVEDCKEWGMLSRSQLNAQLESRFLGPNNTVRTTEMSLLPSNMFRENEKLGVSFWSLSVLSPGWKMEAAPPVKCDRKYGRST